jgi:uncharacterized protein with FMN-binding domain
MRKQNIILVFFMAFLTACGTANSDLEIPKYTVSSQNLYDGEYNIEIRDYAPRLAAQVTVKGERDTALSDGFRILADYIFGNNTAKTDIAMTAPVTQSQTIAMTAPVTQVESAQGWVVQFTMPSQYTAETLPKPNNPQITIVTTQPVRMAALRFSGFSSETRFQNRAKILANYLAEQKIATLGPPEFAYYNDPFTFPWRKRNEVLIPIVSSP